MRPSLICTLYVGVDQTPVEGCKIVFQDEVFRLEHPVKVSDRDEKFDSDMNTPVARNILQSVKPAMTTRGRSVVERTILTAS